MPIHRLPVLLLAFALAAPLLAAESDPEPAGGGGEDSPILGGDGPPGPPRREVDHLVFRDAGDQLAIEIPFTVPLEKGPQALRLHLLRGLSGQLAARLTADRPGLWSRDVNLTRAAQEYATASRRGWGHLKKPPIGGPEADWAELAKSADPDPIELTAPELAAADPRRRRDEPDWPLTLQLTGDALAGSVSFPFDGVALATSLDPGLDADYVAPPGPGGRRPPAPVFELHIEARLAGDTVRGRWRIAGGGREGAGDIAGSVRRGAGGTTAAWPEGTEVHWQYGRGGIGQRIGVGAAPASWSPAPHADARLAWFGLETLAAGTDRNDLRFPQSPGEAQIGGFCSPLLARGVVYQAYYRVSGETLLKPDIRAKNRATYGGQDYEHRHRLRADDVMVAVDATTGRTLWKTVLPSSGYSWSSMHKSGFGPTPAWLDGRLYWLGTSGLLTCLDAATGAALWQTDIGMRHRHLRTAMETRLLPAGEPNGGKRDFVKPLLALDGVVVTCDYQKWMDGTGYHYGRLNGLMAFDAKDGRLLWHAANAMTGGYANFPVVWRHQGRSHLVIIDSTGARCLELASGRQLWSDPRPRSYRCIGHSGIEGDLLLSDAGDEAGEGHGKSPLVGGYRLSATGVEQLWTAPFGATGVPGPKLVLDGRGYFAAAEREEGSLVCIDMATGRVIGEPARLRGGLKGEHDNALILGGDGMLFTSNGREQPGMNAFRLVPEGVVALPDLRVEMTTGYATAIRPIIADGRMIVRLHDRLACFDLRRP